MTEQHYGPTPVDVYAVWRDEGIGPCPLSIVLTPTQAEHLGTTPASSLECEMCERIVCRTFRDGVVSATEFVPYITDDGPNSTGIVTCLLCSVDGFRFGTLGGFVTADVAALLAVDESEDYTPRHAA